jgi:hypothetical protein
MGIRRHQQKNKKNKRPAFAIAVKQAETVRRFAKSTDTPKARRSRRAPASVAVRSPKGRRRIVA